MASPNRYRIGRQSFLEMDRAPAFSQVRVTYAVAVNTDGASIFKDADRGELFQIRTTVDAQGERDVRRLLQFYHNMAGSIHEVRYDWQLYGDYMVDSVQATAMPILKLIGSIRRVNPSHIVEAAWTLYPIRRRFNDTDEATETFVVEGS